MEVSIQIAAQSPEDARALFEKCMELVDSGKKFDGSLVHTGNKGGGCAMLYTFPKVGP
ncbi:hypothetical protein AIRMID_78 [Mycobacterium phage Airmid]|nr:hypothetical protein AIRMID_78 [Mycobacterium phage Airmid]